MLCPVNVLFVAELIDRFGFFAIRKSRQGSWQAQRHITRVFALTKRLPLRILCAVKNLRQVARGVEGGETLQIEKVRSRGTDKWRVGLRGNMGNAFQQRHVLGMLAKLIIADQRSEWRAAEYPVLLFINLLKECALVEFGRLLNISQQLFLADVHDPDLQADA